MKNTCAASEFDRVFELPYLLGSFLAVNAVKDAGIVVDGMACSLQKADFICGNHDLFSGLLSETGDHRVISTSTLPVNRDRNPQKQVAGLVGSVARSGRFSVLLLSALPFLKMAGVDYAGLAASVKGGAPVAEVPPRSFEADWLEGYARAMEALAAALPPARSKKKRKNSVALVGYLMDRHEGDHAANIAELKKLAGFAGLETVSVWLSGGSFGELGRVSEAEFIVSLPYGRGAARALAAKYGAKLVETALPMGLGASRDWVAALRRAAGLKAALPAAYLSEERAAAERLSAAFPVLAHKNALFAGDPNLYSAFARFAAELCVRPSLALLDARPVKLALPLKPELLLFQPKFESVREALAALPAGEKPGLAVLNSFAASEGFFPGVPFIEFGFPSYGHHCLGPEPFLGPAGAAAFASRLLNAVSGALTVAPPRKVSR